MHLKFISCESLLMPLTLMLNMVDGALLELDDRLTSYPFFSLSVNINFAHAVPEMFVVCLTQRPVEYVARLRFEASPTSSWVLRFWPVALISRCCEMLRSQTRF